MKARLETHDGRLTLKVFYDPAICNWDETIAAGLASFGLKQGQAAILAFPIHHPGEDIVFYKGNIRGAKTG